MAADPIACFTGFMPATSTLLDVFWVSRRGQLFDQCCR
jgi:hypothetical protein